MFLITGSRAMKFWFPDSREPDDLDVITDMKIDKMESFKVESFWDPFFNHINNSHDLYMDPDILFTLKYSHLSHNINWDKHMRDFIFLRDKGCELDLTITHNLKFIWANRYKKKGGKINLEVTNEEFFKSNIKRMYDHDYLHEHFKAYEKPLNEYIRKDLSSPKCDYLLFENLSEEDQLLLALEELTVLTCERFIYIEKPLPYKIAKIKMLKNMITSTTGGWFNEFLIFNFDKLLNKELRNEKELIDYLRI